MFIPWNPIFAVGLQNFGKQIVLRISLGIDSQDAPFQIFNCKRHGCDRAYVTHHGGASFGLTGEKSGGEALKRLSRYLDGEAVKQRASDLLVKHARREWPRLVGTVNWVKPVEGIADDLAERIARAVLDELNEILIEPGHPIRRDYERWLRGYIKRLRQDPELAARVARIKQELIDHPSVQDYVRGLWDQIHSALRQDLERDDGVLAGHLERSLVGLGEALGRDESLREAINQHVMGGAEKLALRLRGGVTDYIAQTVKAWDERHLVEQLELSVGRDLQYIRFNGTLVGGLIGLSLHAIIVLLERMP